MEKIQLIKKEIKPNSEYPLWLWDHLAPVSAYQTRMNVWSMNVEGFEPEESEVKGFMRQIKKNNLKYQNAKKVTVKSKIEVS